jgi:predicted kinase
VPRLVVLNGAPGSGKSTLAQRYVDDHPLALDLEIDRLRRQLGRWHDDPIAAGRLARDLAAAAARTHLAAGHDVVLPQYIGRVDVLARFADIAADTGADHHEIVLMEVRDVLVARFLHRSRTSADPVHREAQEMLDRVGGEPQLVAMYDRLLLVLAARPQARVITAREGEIDATYGLFLDAIRDGSGNPSPAR